jgi:predicted DNA-binding transcriptional regulator YafY
MNRTDRLLAMVLELQGRGRRRAEDLARTFEVSKRTVYRDIEALSQAGVPVVSAPGQGYWLMEGYFLPPLQFTKEEATMLSLGAGVMAKTFDAQYSLAAASAGRKIEAVLPEGLRREVGYLEENIRFIVLETPGGSGELLPTLRRTILERKRVRFNYQKRMSTHPGESVTERKVDPYSLFHMMGAWYLMGYCHLRQGARHFRLGRMDGLTVLSERFERQPGLRRRERDRSITVKALFDPEIARWVMESRSFYVTKEEETAEGLLIAMTVRSTEEVVPWLLSWGAKVRVLEPAALIARLSEEARAVLGRY